MAMSFRGPVFIIGMPRSGTKLMRALLNQHPQINLTLAESHFIPYFIRKFGNPPPFRVRDDLQPVVRELQQTAFFSTMSKAGYSLDESTFFQNMDPTKWNTIFEHVFRHFGSKREMTDTIWGDKTPGYINHIPLLKELFPEAKFLHIVRDPRDYCLSVRKSFKKSIYRAAARWRHGVENAHTYGTRLGQDYLEIHYERLLEEPIPTMKEVSSFLGVAYDDTLVDLASAPEDLGDAKGHHKIVTSNKNKYRAQLSSREIGRIEEIVCEVAKAVGYDLGDKVYKPLNFLALVVLKLHDGIASLRHHVVSEGEFARGTKHFFHHYMRSSWRGVQSS
jgi:Sulfotransferase family